MTSAMVLLIVTMFYANGETDTVERLVPSMGACHKIANAIHSSGVKGPWESIEVVCKKRKGGL